MHLHILLNPDILEKVFSVVEYEFHGRSYDYEEKISKRKVNDA